MINQKTCQKVDKIPTIGGFCREFFKNIISRYFELSALLALA